MIKLASASQGSNTKYAAVTFANSVTVNFMFLPYHEVANKIESIPYPREGGGGGGVRGLTNNQVGLSEAKSRDTQRRFPPKCFENTFLGFFKTFANAF